MSHHKHRPRACPTTPEQCCVCKNFAALQLKPCLPKAPGWAARPLPDAAFRTISFFSHPLSEIKTIPHPSVLSPKPNSPVQVLPWLSAHSSSALPRAQLHLCLLQGLVLGVTTHVPPPLLPPSSSPREVPRQVRRDSRAKFLTLDGMRELGSQGTEKKKQQQSKAAASSLASPVPTQV